MEKEWINLRFHLTEEMNNMMIELLVTEQMMKENKLTKKERKLLENHKAELLEDFRKEILVLYFKSFFYC